MEIKHPHRCKDQGLSDLITVPKAEQETGSHDTSKVNTIATWPFSLGLSSKLVWKKSLQMKGFICFWFNQNGSHFLSESISRNASYLVYLWKYLVYLHVFPNISLGLVAFLWRRVFDLNITANRNRIANWNSNASAHTLFLCSSPNVLLWESSRPKNRT